MAINVKGATPPAPGTPPAPKPALQSIAHPKTGELFAAMATIKKQLGEKSIVYGNQIPNPERLPTGVFEFDLATGGGFPKNRYSIVYGPESSGKTNLVYKAIASAQRLPPPCNKAVLVDLEGCVAFDSRFMDMATGQVYTAEEVFVEKLPLTVRSFNYEEGRVQIEPLSAWFDNGVKPVYEIETSSAAVRATDNHRFWVCQTLDSAPEWVRADTIEEGWYLASPNADKNWEWPTVNQVTPTESRFIGLMLGDGCMVGGGSPTFANIDPDVVADMRTIIESWGGTLTTYSDRHHRLSGLGKASKWHPATATTLLKKVGVWGSKGRDKYIPEAVFESGKDVALQCLAGLYLTDGTVSTVRPTLALSNTSLTLMEQVRELWRRLGVPSSLHKTKMYQEHHAQQYILSINTTAMLRVVAEMLPLYGYKQKQLLHWAAQPVAQKQGYGFNKFTGPLVWNRITSIELGEPVQTYDFTVMGTHNYVVNDFVAHNTFDPAWASQFGIDVDQLIVAKPSYGEQAVDMIDALVRASDVAFLAVDSIAVLVAARELEGSTEKADVGSAALLTKRLANKVAVALSEEQKRDHNIAVVFLNQTRFKIGVMFGDPETMPGGQTVKFNASLIVRLFGKNKMVKEISASVPAFKETHAVIKKAKIGITQAAFDYDMCMYEHDGLCPGETASFNAVKGYLQTAGYLKKSEKGNGWDLLGKSYATQSIIQDTYYAEPSFANTLNGLVVKSQTLALVAAEPEQPSDYTAPTAP